MIERIKQRKDFLAAQGGQRWTTPGFVVQLRPRGDAAAPRVGFTATKKLGNAVTRNRIKRRLRALADQVLAQSGQPGTDYVLIGREAGVTAPFTDLERDLKWALRKLAGKANS
jgi:ribonuclease P protein component